MNTTDDDWRRAYAESDGDHCSYVKHHAKTQTSISGYARVLLLRVDLRALSERIEERERIALAIHDARYAHPEYPRRPDPFTDRGDREYAFRLADAALAIIRAGGSDDARCR